MYRQEISTRLLRASIILFSFALVTSSNIFGQGGSCIFDTVNASNPKNFINLKQKQVSGLSINKGRFRGLLEYTPAGYYTPGNTTKYPVIIYFHGVGAVGRGAAKDLCKILWDGYAAAGNSLPGRIERNQFPTSLLFGGVNYSFIVISPQYTTYIYPTNFPSANDVDSVIKYVKQKYRVDPKRVYLTGMSSGANMVAEYAGSSIARANTIAAAGVASLASVPNSATNVANGIKPANIGLGKLPVRFIHCHSDVQHPDTIPIAWVNGIKAVVGEVAPQLILLNNTNTDVNLRCNPVPHNTWSKFYDPNFRFGTKNIYEYFIQYSRPLLTSGASEDELVQEVRSKTAALVQPNPFTDVLSTNFNVNRTQKVIALVTNISGQQLTSASMVCRPGMNQLRLNTSKLPPGLYFLQVKAEDYTITQKVIKQ